MNKTSFIVTFLEMNYRTQLKSFFYWNCFDSMKENDDDDLIKKIKLI